MPKPNMLRSTLYRILACLSAVTLLIGSAAAPAANPTPTPAPPETTPAEEGWDDWSARSQITAEQEQGAFTAPNQGMRYDLNCSSEPNPKKYLYIVYSLAHDNTEWDEEIFLMPGLCTDLEYGTRLTHSPGADFEPRMSKDGQSIVFVSARNSTSQKTVMNIYTMSYDGKNQRQITNTIAMDRMPSFSPDGKKIVFVSTRDGNGEIYVMNIDGSQQRRLTYSVEPDVQPDWSPDGKSIVWVRRMADGNGLLSIMNADGTNPRIIGIPYLYLGRPIWSPSGNFLLFHADFNGDGWIEGARIKPDGTNFLRLTLPTTVHDQSQDFEVSSWLPDESGLIYNVLKYSFDLTTRKWVLTNSSERISYFDTPDKYGAFLRYSHYHYFYMFTPHVVNMDTVAPVSKIKPLPEFSHYENVLLNWSTSDNFSGSQIVVIESNTSSYPGWQWVPGSYAEPYVDPSFGTVNFTGIPGDTVKFRIYTTDQAGNQEEPRPYDAITHLYKWTALAKVTDARGQPLGTVTSAITPQVMNQPITGSDGNALFYFSNSGNYQAAFNKTGYASSSPQNWPVIENSAFLAVLTGPDEQVVNGNFEAQAPLEGWETSGQFVGKVEESPYGTRSVRIGNTNGEMFRLTSPTPLPDTGVIPQAVGYDNSGRLHILHNDDQYGILGEDGIIEPWPALPVKDARNEIKFDYSGQPYFTTNTQVIRWNGSEWVSVTVPIPAEASAQYGIDGAGMIHAIYSDPTTQAVWYMRQATDGSWRAPIQVHNSTSDSFAITIEPNGTVYMVARYNFMLLMHLDTNGLLRKENIYLPNISKTKFSLHYVPERGTYIIFTEGNGWSTRQCNYYFSSVTKGTGEFVGLKYDTERNIYILSRNQPLDQPFEDMKLKVLTPDSKSIDYTLSLNVTDILFEVMADGTPFFMYGIEKNGSKTYQYQNALYEQLSETNTLSQVISVDAGMRAPTLSFFYSLHSLNVTTQSTFEVIFTPDGSEAITLFRKKADPVGWTHAWADLSPYLGQSGTLSFRVVQVAGEKPVSAFIDEVSVSSYPTPILQQIAPTPLDYPVPVDLWMELTGFNLQNGATVLMDGNPIAMVEYSDGTQIRFLVPQGLKLGRHEVQVVNPGGGENSLFFYVGKPLFLPTVGK